MNIIPELSSSLIPVAPAKTPNPPQELKNTSKSPEILDTPGDAVPFPEEFPPVEGTHPVVELGTAIIFG